MNDFRCFSLFLIIFVTFCHRGECNADAKRLYHDLLSSYSSLVRPVGNNSDRLTVNIGLKLSQLIDVNLKYQIMTTNMWVLQEWMDYKLQWNPEEYGGVTKLHVPAEQIWLPDIVLYNNADGNYEVTIMTKAILHYDGLVIWKPPAIYKSSCEIDVLYFPFDQQTCRLKFGSWTYDGYTVDLKHKNQQEGSEDIPVGIDLSEFYLSVEWDIMSVPAIRTESYYSCCEEPYPDITFYLTLRRKTLFYTVNLIIPCVAISFLSIMVFYLPSDSGEKVSLSISIMLSLGVFFLLLSEIIPPTSLAVPLLGKYLLFTMVLVSLSVFVTISILNVNFRNPGTHKMAPWVKRIFLDVLPNILHMQRPEEDDNENNQDREGAGLFENTEEHNSSPIVSKAVAADGIIDMSCSAPVDAFVQMSDGAYPDCDTGSLPDEQYPDSSTDGGDSNQPQNEIVSEWDRTIINTRFIAHHMDNSDNFEKIGDNWQFVALVLDRMFLYLFTITCVVGSACIIFAAPSLFDDKIPIDILLSKVAPRARQYQQRI